MTGNERRRLIRAEGRAYDSGTVLLIGVMCAVWGITPLYVGVAVGLGIRWLSESDDRADPAPVLALRSIGSIVNLSTRSDQAQS